MNTAYNPAIYTQGLSKRFGSTDVLSSVAFAVPEGAIYALVGANGAGKTTIIKLLMNILRPTLGSAHVLGIDSHHIEGEAFNRIGYVSENQEMPDWMTVQSMLIICGRFIRTGTGPSSNSSSANSISRSSASSNTSPAA